MTRHSLYFDYNATAPLCPEAKEIMSQILGQPLNASAVHNYGRAGRKYVEDSRKTLAQYLNIPPAQLIFNSGATEGNNTVLKHFAHAYPDQTMIVSAIEHHAVLDACPKALKAPVTSEGVLHLEALERLLKDHERNVSLVSIMMANNETGIIQPVKEAAALAHKYGALFHCDAVQAFTKIPVDIEALGIDFLTLSAHKFGGPQGIGALAMRLCGETPVLLHGGGQERSARAGTENIAGIAGMATAAKAAFHRQEEVQTRLARFQKQIETHIMNAMPTARIFGRDCARLANTTLAAFPGITSETLLMAFDLEGVALSNGSACSSGRVEPSHVLLAMGEDKEMARSALRISTGWATAQDQTDHLLKIFDKVFNRLQK